MSNMNLSTFAEELDRLGGNLTSWPTARRSAAEELLAESARARDLLNDTRELDAALAELPRINAGPHLQQHILTSIAGAGDALQPDRWQRLVNWFAAAFWRPVLAGALPLVLGFAAGLYDSAVEEQYLAEDISFLAFTTSFEEYADDE